MCKNLHIECILGSKYFACSEVFVILEVWTQALGV